MPFLAQPKENRHVGLEGGVVDFWRLIFIGSRISLYFILGQRGCDSILLRCILARMFFLDHRLSLERKSLGICSRSQLHILEVEDIMRASD